MVVSACRIGPRKRFFSEMKGGRFRLSRPLSGKARSRSEHGAPAGHRAESRPDIRLVGTAPGRRSKRGRQPMNSKKAKRRHRSFRSGDQVSAQARCRRNQADIGPAPERSDGRYPLRIASLRLLASAKSHKKTPSPPGHAEKELRLRLIGFFRSTARALAATLPSWLF